MVIWTWVKNIQKRGRAHKVPILHIPGSSLCPVEAYKNMCHLAPLEGQHPAFAIKSSRGPVQGIYQQFNQKLKKLIGACGFNPEDFSTHSCRRGGATCAFQEDVPEILIQLQGDWASDCYMKYLQMCRAEKEQCCLDWLITLCKNAIVRGGFDWFCSINACTWGWR